MNDPKVIAGRRPLIGEMDVVVGDSFTFTLIADSLPDDVSFWWPDANNGKRVILTREYADDSDSATFALDIQGVKDFVRDYKDGFGDPQLDIGNYVTIVFKTVRIHTPSSEMS